MRASAIRAGLVAAAATLVAAWATPASATETFFQIDVRAGGYYAVVENVQAGAFMGGLHLGGLTWFGDDPIVGLLYMGGVEGGPEFPESTKTTGTVGLSGALGPAFLLSGQPKDGAVLSLGWAPRMFVNFNGKLASSPAGAELAINAAAFKLPLWFLRTLDGATFVGFGVGMDIMRLVP